MTITEEKRALRKALIQRRKDIPADKKAQADLRIFESLKPLLEKCSSVFTYVSTEIEVDTRMLLDWCFENGKPVASPVSGDHELTFYPLHSMRKIRHNGACQSNSACDTRRRFPVRCSGADLRQIRTADGIRQGILRQVPGRISRKVGYNLLFGFRG